MKVGIELSSINFFLSTVISGCYQITIERYFVHWEDSVINPEESSSITSSYFKRQLKWDHNMILHYRGTILGERTYGSTDQPAYVNLADNINIGIGSITLRDSRITRALEGHH